ncbi:DUF3800 domain-containing protein [Alterinioella nitratireducens]|uniref:DUF3800 domain-containing protein n=1 Tax=Alterinioella nitratireducens TaxID=2735915 RepID=UPI001553925A|nr:DUF3800 domain-containing protein [Alterinioella nitratireducens]NPD20138.1 DUF3800 domain-containing protein [Alterinioella nitratireducens]
MAAQNKRILCFIDECGTAGEDGFALGCVMAWARDCGRADKSLSDLLEPNANELHAANLSKEYLQSLLTRFSQTDRPQGIVMMNRLGTVTQGTPAAIYANNVIETVKVAVGQFRKLHQIGGRGIGNVELVLDRNHHNSDPECQRIIGYAADNDGRFKAVDAVVQIDSAASRLLQLADAVAYSRMWIHRGEENAKGLHEYFGIMVL